jgi:heme-degrading monooxygenase HmoA
MFAVIFEVKPKAGQFDAYLSLAALLRPEVERIEGFIDNRRFRSKSREDWMVSVSFWRDEKSLIRWRTHAGHHLVQQRGRADVFDDYHLRVGEVFAGDGAASAPSRLDETEKGEARAISVIDEPHDAAPSAPGLIGHESFEGITIPGSRLQLLAWRDRQSCADWQGRGADRRRDVRIVRDYTKADRYEAPQYFA